MHVNSSWLFSLLISLTQISLKYKTFSVLVHLSHSTGIHLAFSLLFNIITSTVGAIVCLILTLYGARVTWEMLETSYRIATHLEPPKFIILAIIPVGSFLLFMQFLRKTYGYLGILRAPREQE